jgi:hypothetical protein
VSLTDKRDSAIRLSADHSGKLCRETYEACSLWLFQWTLLEEEGLISPLYAD